MALETIIEAGTVSVTNGSATATGNGTAWLASGVKPGDLYRIDSTGIINIVDEVVSDTEITFTAAYTGATASSLSYQIILQAPTTRTAENSTKLRELLGYLDNNTYHKSVKLTLAQFNALPTKEQETIYAIIET